VILVVWNEELAVVEFVVGASLSEMVADLVAVDPWPQERVEWDVVVVVVAAASLPRMVANRLVVDPWHRETEGLS